MDVCKNAKVQVSQNATSTKCKMEWPFKSIDVTDCICMTYDDTSGIVVGECITNCFNNNLNESYRYYYRLPSNLSELNKAMSEDHWNRG